MNIGNSTIVPIVDKCVPWMSRFGVWLWRGRHAVPEPYGGALHWVGWVERVIDQRLGVNDIGLPGPRRPESRTTPVEVERLLACHTLKGAAANNAIGTKDAMCEAGRLQ